MTTSATVTQYYNNVIQRDPSASELSSWVALIDSGALTTAQVLDAIVNSPEAQTYTAQVIRFYQAAFGRLPDTTGINGWVDDLVAGTTTTTQLAVGFVLSAEWTARYGGTEVNQATLTGLYQNVLGRTPTAAEIQAWIDTGLSLDQVFIGFANSAEFQANSNDAVNTLMTNAGNTATADIATVYDPSKSLDVTTGTGQTFTLTTGVDNIVGTNSGDTIIGALSGANDTFSPGDSINAGAGEDTFRLFNGDGNVVTNTASISGVETFEIQDAQATTGTYSYNVGGVGGLTKLILVNEDNNGDTTTVSGMSSSVAVELNAFADGEIDLQFSDEDDSGDQTVNVTMIGGKNSNTSLLTVDKIETLNISASGSKTTIEDIDADDVKTLSIAADEDLTVADDMTLGGDTATINISGDSKVTFGDAITGVDATLTAINVSGTATFIHKADDLDATANALVVTASGDAALDVRTETATHKVTGGSQADRIDIDDTVFNTTGSVDGGGGTADTLAIADDTATLFTTAAKANISNFEILEVSGTNKTFDFEALSGLTGLVIGAATSADIDNVSDSAAAAGINVTGDQTTALSVGVKGASTPATANTVKLNIDNSTDDTDVDIADFEAIGVETLEIVSTGAGTQENSLELATANDRLATVTISGDSDFELTDAGDVGVEMAINASAATGAIEIVLNQNTSGQAITGSSTAKNTITGGTAVDTITGGSNEDAIDGGLGVDTIDLVSGSDTLVFNLTTAQAIAANRVTVKNFDVATDSIDANGTAFSTLGAGGNDDITGGGIVTGEFSSITTAGNVTTADPVAVVELAFEFSSGVDLDDGSANSLNGTNLLAALGATTGTTAGTITTAGNDEDLLIIAYQDGDALMYHGNGAGGNTALINTEISLIAVFEGVGVGDFTFQDFI